MSQCLVLVFVVVSKAWSWTVCIPQTLHRPVSMKPDGLPDTSSLRLRRTTFPQVRGQKLRAYNDSDWTDNNFIFSVSWSGVAPFSGATTGTGGRIRDVQSAGKGGHVIAGTAGYCFGNLHIPGKIIGLMNIFFEFVKLTFYCEHAFFILRVCAPLGGRGVGVSIQLCPSSSGGYRGQ